MFDKQRFKAQLVLSGMTMEELAKVIGVNPATLYRKVNDDGRFTRKEINDMITALGIQNPNEIFFANELV